MSSYIRRLALTRYLYLSIIVLLFGCGALPTTNPVISEEKVVVTTEDESKTITLNEPQVWFDGYQKNSGVMLPKGTYQLEAQDADYLYFRAPLDIEFRSLNETPQTQEFVKGGIAIAKNSLNIIPACIYKSIQNDKKVLSWKLGNHFLRMEDGHWKKDY
ncbi:hypothetical protein ACVFI8_01355 [Agarivorans sp. MS3-6]